MTVLPLLAGLQLAAAVLPVQAVELPAPAVVVHETDGPLSLMTTFSSSMDDMTPGDSADWTVTPLLAGNLTSPLSIRIISDGELADHVHGAHLLLRRCVEPWEGRTCPAGAVTMVDSPLRALDPHIVHAAGAITGPRGPYFLASISLPEEMPDDLQSSHLSVGMGFTALGDEEMVGSSPLPGPASGNLAATGGAPFIPLLAAGVIAVLVGLGVRLRAATRSAR